jgi:putative acetyltransferase
MLIRHEAPGDLAEISRITSAAFAGKAYSNGTEAAVIDRLRQSGALLLSSVAVHAGEIVGHIAFSRVLIDGQDLGWVALGPVSVRPDRQRAGVGAALIRDGLDNIRSLGASGCVLLGDPGYYRRFDFRNDEALQYKGAPTRFFMCLAFGHHVPTGTVTFNPAFDD